MSLAVEMTDEDPRRARIMEGALKVFLAYGFSRTTMDDIARAAELSRPALYLIFRNKTDIYRAIAQCVLDRSLEVARHELAAPGSLTERLDRLVTNALYCLMKDIEEAPHGPEILDMRTSLAGDIIAEWRSRIDALIEAAIRTEAQAAGVDLAARGIDASTLAQMLLDSLEGMKPRVSDPDDHLAAAKRLVRVIVAVLRA